MRIYVESNDGDERVPTKKGVALTVDLSPVRLATLEVARQRTRAQGK